MLAAPSEKCKASIRRSFQRNYYVGILLYDFHGLDYPKQTYKILTYNNIFILFRGKIIANNTYLLRT